MKKHFIILLLFFSTLFVNANEVDFYNSNFYKADITAKSAYDMQQKGAILIDIRTKKEFIESKAKNSINIPIFYDNKGQRIFNKEFINQIYSHANNDLNKKIILICRSGSRTKLASNILAYNGFTNIYNVKNGFTFDWIKQKLPIE